MQDKITHMNPEVDRYIAQFEGTTRERLEKVRGIIRARLPEAEERLSYRMPAYFLGRKPVVYFAGYAKHLGVYPGKVATGDLAKLIGPYLKGASTAQFPHDMPLPEELIGALVAFRAQEVAANNPTALTKQGGKDGTKD